jgi:competence protein ComEC
LTPIGRALSKKKGDNFTADIWMENDGMRIDREVAFNLWKDNVHDIRHFWSKRDNGRSVICAKDDIIVTIVDLNVTGPCTIIMSETLEHFGSMALWRDQNGAIKKSENDA